MKEPSSKIKQIEVKGKSGEEYIVCLCEDGSIWTYSKTWEVIFSPKFKSIDYPICGSRWIKNGYGYEVEIYRTELEDQKTIICFVTDDGEEDEGVLEDFLKIFTPK